MMFFHNWQLCETCYLRYGVLISKDNHHRYDRTIAALVGQCTCELCQTTMTKLSKDEHQFIEFEKVEYI